MDVNVERTLFLVDLDSLEVTICTWMGEEAKVPVTHLCSLVDHLRSVGIHLPVCPPVFVRAHDDADAG